MKDSKESKLLIKKKPTKKEKFPEYEEYQAYIKSDEWQEIRKIVLERDNYRCACCGWSPDEYDSDKKSLKRTLTVHHKSYKNLYHEREHLDDLITLDNICHQAIHKSPSNFCRFKHKPKKK